MRWRTPQGGLIRSRGRKWVSGGSGSSTLFTVSIGSGNVTSGTELTAVISGLVGGETVTYQWTDDGVDISGATLTTYRPIIGEDGVAEAAAIRCVATIDGEPYPSNARTVSAAAGSLWIISSPFIVDSPTITPPTVSGSSITG